jgi:hypothetical protein
MRLGGRQWWRSCGGAWRPTGISEGERVRTVGSREKAIDDGESTSVGAESAAVTLEAVEAGNREVPHGRRLLMVIFRQTSHEFTFSVGNDLIPNPMILTPLI